MVEALLLFGMLATIVLLTLYVAYEVRRAAAPCRPQRRVRTAHPAPTARKPAPPPVRATSGKRPRFVREDDDTWRTLEANAGPPPTLMSGAQYRAYYGPRQAAVLRPTPAPSSAARPAGGFEDRCGQAIVNVFHDAGVGFRAWSKDSTRPRPVRGARTLTYFLLIDRPSDLERVFVLDERLAMLANLEGARVARYGARLGIEFQLPPQEWQAVSLDQPATLPALRLGQDTLNRPIEINLRSPNTPHALIAGTTGSGKTTLLRTLLYQLGRSDPATNRLLLIDGKAALRDFHQLPHLLMRPALDPPEALQVLSFAAAEIMRRREPGSDQTPITLVIDELALLKMQTTGAMRPLGVILSQGREFGVSAIGGTQHVSADVIDRFIQANFSARLAGRVVDAPASVLATGQPGMGANRLSGSGDFLAVVGTDGHRFVAAQVGEEQIASLPRVEVVPQPAALTTDPLAMLETLPAPPGQAPLPTTPDLYAATLAAYVHGGHAWPGIGALAGTLKVGKARAERVRSEAQELAALLDQAGVGMYVVERGE